MILVKTVPSSLPRWAQLGLRPATAASGLVSLAKGVMQFRQRMEYSVGGPQHRCLCFKYSLSQSNGDVSEVKMFPSATRRKGGI